MPEPGLEPGRRHRRQRNLSPGVYQFRHSGTACSIRRRAERADGIVAGWDGIRACPGSDTEAMARAELHAARGAAGWSDPAGQADGPKAPVTKSQAAKTKIGVATA